MVARLLLAITCLSAVTADHLSFHVSDQVIKGENITAVLG